MFVMVKYTIFDRYGERPVMVVTEPDISRVHAGQVLSSWWVVSQNVGYALLKVTSMADVVPLLKRTFPDARHIEITDTVAVEGLTVAWQPEAERSAPRTLDAAAS